MPAAFVTVNVNSGFAVPALRTASAEVESSDHTPPEMSALTIALLLTSVLKLLPEANEVSLMPVLSRATLQLKVVLESVAQAFGVTVKVR